jgi:hypothetical protein
VSISVAAVSRSVANVSQPRIALSGVVGGFELAFTVDGFSVPRIGEQPIIWIAPDLARISIGSNSQDLGTARPNNSLRVRTLTSALPFSYEFRIGLSAAQLAAIEEIRSGGDLPYRLMISGIAGNENDLAQLEMFQVVLTHSVPQSEWIQHLKSAKAMDILLLEIVMPFVDPPSGTAVVMNMLRQAQSLFVAAHYTDCVINCRKAIEAFENLVGRDRAGLLKRLAEDRDSLNKDQRRTTIEAAVFHFGSLAAHDEASVFDRRDARLALALTAALVAHELS